MPFSEATPAKSPIYEKASVLFGLATLLYVSFANPELKDLSTDELP